MAGTCSIRTLDQELRVPWSRTSSTTREVRRSRPRRWKAGSSALREPMSWPPASDWWRWPQARVRRPSSAPQQEPRGRRRRGESSCSRDRAQRVGQASGRGAADGLAGEAIVHAGEHSTARRLDRAADPASVGRQGRDPTSSASAGLRDATVLACGDHLNDLGVRMLAESIAPASVHSRLAQPPTVATNYEDGATHGDQRLG